MDRYKLFQPCLRRHPYGGKSDETRKEEKLDIFEECTKCKSSFVYFVENYVKIIHPTRGLIGFKLYDFQKSYIQELESNRFVIGVKFRQGGFTTSTAIYGLWKCLFGLDENWLFVSKTDREATGIGRVVQTVIDNLPEQLKSFLSHKSDHEKKFGVTGSAMRFLPMQAMCSVAVTNLVIDEAAFIPNMDEHWKSLIPSLSTGGKCVVLSTVNGVGNWFADTWNSAVEKRNQFKPLKYHYTEHPDFRSPEWVVQMKNNLGEKGFKQEMEGEFVSKHNADWHARQSKKQAIIKMINELFGDE